MPAAGGTRATRGARRGWGDPDGAAARDALLAGAVRKAVQSSEAYGCVMYLRSRDRRSLLLSTVAGVPVSLLSGFRSLPVNGRLPVPAAYRTGRTVYLSGAEETLRRFPQLLMGLPYAFATVCVPVTAGAERFGVLCAFWPGSAQGVAPSARRHLRAIANRLGASLATLTGRAGRVDPVESDGGTAVVELPAAAGPAITVGLFDWDLATGAFSADETAREVLGLPAGTPGTVDAVAERLHPADRPEFLAAAEEVRTHGRLLGLHLRVEDEDGDGRQRPVELWGQVPGTDAGHLLGVVLDSRTGAAAAGAVERLPHAVFSLDPDGWISYVNHRTELLLETSREDLLGRHPWDALPWLSDPSYEDRYRAAMLSQQPTSFLACCPPERWLAFSLYPDAHGVTGTVAPAAAPNRPPPSPDTRSTPAPASVGAMYHLLQLAGLLTQAVTVSEVCETVADQILPGFGGQQLAIYVIRDNRLHLALETGYPDGFLDEFEGTPMRARLPGVETLNTGSPIFFESAHDLSSAYPGIPLDEMSSWAFLPLIASGHPVGSCILGFEEPRPFTTEERGVLTALSGLIAQALERARLYDTEFALARGLQHALLPHRLPKIPGLATAARYLPGTIGMEIGGDWYDVIVTAQGICLVIGDVEGHSVAAAALMGQLRSAVRAFVTSVGRPEEVLARTNQLLTDLDPGLLASCLLLRIDPADGRALAVRAGHLPPLLRHADGRTEVLDLPGGPLLGIDRTAEYPVSSLHLPPGAVLALYTDGLVEEPGLEIDLGVDRLRAALAHAEAGSLEALADRLTGDARRSKHRADDVALLLTARTAAGGPDS
ncbi:SpoIIE family protein phosphatase [Kitasatospora sp. MAA4]|uniref:SpoIIE family protein phosphatase n=1 Tax=Kitasatospora sp. MAA4 TaxID=3035093 RepID=UPI0024751A23|nr:SpoIIE family protein phosphatase [Kitasatospora sp. MAA4]